MKLLVAVDGSQTSYNAAKKSAEIAKKYGFEVGLLTVVDDDAVSRHSRNEKLWRQVDGSSISGRTRTVDVEEVAGGLRENALQQLDMLTDRLDFKDVRIGKAVLFGEPCQMILEAAEKEKVDLIVVGNRGYSKAKRSVAEKVIAEATCPVLVIHADPEE